MDLPTALRELAAELGREWNRGTRSAATDLSDLQEVLLRIAAKIDPTTRMRPHLERAKTHASAARLKAAAKKPRRG